MKTLNVRLIGGLAATLVAIGLAGYFLHDFQTGRNADAYLREGRRAQKENRPQEALRHFNRYVKLAPQDTEGLALYGLQLADVGQFQQAYLVLGQALRREPERDDLRRRLVEVAISLGRYGDALVNLEGWKDLEEPPSEKKPSHYVMKKSPGDGKLLVQAGICRAALDQIPLALKRLESASAVSPEQLESYVLLAGLLARDGKTKDAERWLAQMVEKNAKDHRAYIVRGRWHLDPKARAGGPQSTDGPEPDSAESAAAKAWEDAGRALELAPKEPEALLFAAKAAVETGRRDEARAIALRALDVAPANPQVYSLLADVASAGGDPDAAVDWLERGAAAVPDDTDLRWNWAHLLIEQGEVRKAIPQLKKLRDDGHAAAAVAYLEARAKIAEGRWLDGARQLEKVRPELAEWPDLQKQADLWTGKCYQELGNADQQIAAYRRALTTDPAWVPARLGVADALLALGRLQEAQDQYRQAKDARGEVPLVALLKRAHILLAMNLRLDREQRDWAPLNTLLDQIDRAQPGTPQVVLLRAEALLAQERVGDAETLIASAREKDPGRLEFWAAQVALAQRGGDWPRVDQLLRDAAGRVDDAVGLRLLEARSLALRLGKEAPAQLRKLWQGSPPEWKPEERVRLADGLANLALALGDFDLASELGTIVSDAQPNNMRIRLLLLDAAFRGGREDAVTPILADLRRIEGEGPLWHYAEALRLTASAKADPESPLLAQAETHLAAAKVGRPGWSRLPLLSAEIAKLRGNDDRAADAYLEAISLGERRSEVIGRAVAVLFQRKRDLEADQVIRRLQEQQTAFTGELSRLAAETSLRLEDFGRALDFAQSVATDSNNPLDHVWVGRVHARLNQFEEAEQEFRRAVQLADGPPEPWIALVQFLAQRGRTQEAEQSVAEARDAVGAERALVTVAQCYEVLGRAEAADEHYRKALEQSPDDPTVARHAGDFFLKSRKASQAESILRRFSLGELSGSDRDLRWARRNLALIVGSRGGSGYAEARKLLQANTSMTESLPEDVRADERARAMILAMQPSRDMRRQAIEALARLLADEQTASADDRFVLAELYRRDGDLPKAAAEMAKIVTARQNGPNESRYLAAYLRILLERGETSDADLWLSRLKNVAPQEPSTVELEVRVLLSKSRDREAAELLAGFASLPNGDAAPGAFDRRLWAAEKYEQFAGDLRKSGRDESVAKFLAEAESLFAAHARENPADVPLFAAFLARQNQVGRALDLLPKSLDAADPQQVSALVAAVLTSAGSTPDDLKRFQSLLEASRGGSAAAEGLELAVADLCSWRGDYPAAEKAYREVLRKNGRHVAAMNNLAIVLGMGQRRHDEALRLIEGAIEAVGPVGALLDTRGLLHLAAGRAQEARKDFDRAIDDDRNAPDRHLHLAMALSRLGDAKAAKAALAEAERLGLSESQLHPLERSAMRELSLAKR